MIWHFLEVWGLLLAAFAAGCVLGTLLYMAVAMSPLANAQVAAADAIGDAAGGFRVRLGGGRERSGYRRAVEAERYAPPAALPPADYPDTQAAPLRGNVEPVEGAVDAIDATYEALESEWEDEAYWDDDREDRPLTDGGLTATVPLPERPLPVESIPVLPEPEPELPAMRPLTLPAPRNGVPDNLQRVRGIGQKNEELLNSLGIYHFGQIAAWTPAEARWVASHLAFPERIERDDWVGQAIILATGGDTGYVKVAERRKGSEEPPVAA